mmetsp:Transcript_6346/g.19923  ORF Transcript_6346/g.19923 Transcript_6346/m.19923 type:complete len:269 (-) Transcript_6346:467-1273(-)
MSAAGLTLAPHLASRVSERWSMSCVSLDYGVAVCEHLRRWVDGNVRARGRPRSCERPCHRLTWRTSGARGACSRTASRQLAQAALKAHALACGMRLRVRFGRAGEVLAQESRPATSIASASGMWNSGSSCVSGSRMPGPALPMRSSAHLTGMGLGCRKRRLCSSSSCAFSSRARVASPIRAHAITSRFMEGATLLVTEIVPSPPARTKSTAVPSSPLYSRKSGPHSSRNGATRITSPVASLTPTMRGCWLSAPTVIGVMSTPVRDGTL